MQATPPISSATASATLGSPPLPSGATPASFTTIEGLFACGEIAGGTHGRNRMMGNSLLECTVFGRRAGEAAARAAA